ISTCEIDSLVSILYLPYFCICGYLSHSNNFFKERHKNGKERRIGKIARCSFASQKISNKERPLNKIE
ncbi:MAG: hypothetical protein WCE25_03410, partial [Nitrososphaeraceae archaeon]